MTHWIVAHHGIFQGYHYFHHYDRDPQERERFRDHPAYEAALVFSDWDRRSFDPAYDTLPLEAFEPAIRRVFAREIWSVGNR